MYEEQKNSKHKKLNTCPSFKKNEKQSKRKDISVKPYETMHTSIKN